MVQFPMVNHDKRKNIERVCVNDEEYHKKIINIPLKVLLNSAAPEFRGETYLAVVY